MDGSGETIFTDQMPVAIQLNGKDRIAVALESRFGRTGTSADQYNLTMAYSSDNWASGGLTGDAEGPADQKVKHLHGRSRTLSQAVPLRRDNAFLQCRQDFLHQDGQRIGRQVRNADAKLRKRMLGLIGNH